MTNIYDVDVSNEFEVELLVYSRESRSIYWINREKYAIAFKWSSNFWIYLIMYIHIAAVVLGILHFTLILHNTSRVKDVKSVS